MAAMAALCPQSTPEARLPARNELLVMPSSERRAVNPTS